MINSPDRRANERTEREAKAKTVRRAEEAAVVAGLKSVLDADEQLLGFARGRISGGFFGKLTIGPEAFFAPYVNFGLTERRFVLQHVHAETGKPSEMLPHFFPLSDVQFVTFSDVETFGTTPACRLALRLRNDQFFRIRFVGQNNFESIQTVAEVFRSLTTMHRDATTPTQRICTTCKHVLDHPARFCPYCGAQQAETASQDAPVTETSPPTSTSEAGFKPDLIDEALSFLSPEPVVPPASSAMKDTPVAEVPPTAGEAETEAHTPTASDREASDAPVAEVPAPPESGNGVHSPSADINDTVSTTDPLPPVAEAFAEPPVPSVNSEIPTDKATFGESLPPVAEFGVTPTRESSGPTALDVHPEASTEEEARPESSPAAGPKLAAETSLEAPVVPPVTTTSAAPHVPPMVDYVPPRFAASEPFELPQETALPVPGTIYTTSEIAEPEITPSLSEPTVTFSGTPGTSQKTLGDLPGFVMPNTPPAPAADAEAAVKPEAPVPPVASRVSEPAPESRASAASPSINMNGPLKVNFHVNRPPLQINETLTGENAEDVVKRLKERVAPQLPFPMRLLMTQMGALSFAQEVVRRYNDKMETTLPVPKSCAEFLHQCAGLGFATFEAANQP